MAMLLPDSGTTRKRRRGSRRRGAKTQDGNPGGQEPTA